MDKLETVCKIGNEICADCGENRDCGIEFDDCDRIQNAISVLDEYCNGNIELENGHKPCPFNKEHKNLTVELNRQAGYYVLCHTCLTSGPYGETEKDAWEKWNERS